jgi:Lon protease-like protein
MTSLVIVCRRRVKQIRAFETRRERRTIAAVSDLLRLFPLEVVLFPETALPLHIFEPRYKEMISECMQQKQPFGVIRVVPGEKVVRLAEFGCTARITDLLRAYPDGRMDILTTGGRRFELMEINEDRDFVRGEVEFFDDDADTTITPNELAHIRKRILELHANLLLLTDSEDTTVDKGTELLSFQLASALPVDLDFKQSLLEMRSEPERLKLLLDYYNKIIPKLKMMALGRQRAGGNGFIH